MEAVMVLVTLIHSRTGRGNRLYVLFIDLRTAFPSLNRPIVLRRMFQVGLGLGICRLVLAMFDVTTGSVRLGGLLSMPFLETRGVRE
eukprot:193930-Karenia_brevis.AAC.1